MTLKELEQQLLSLSPDRQIEVIHLLAQSLGNKQPSFAKTDTVNRDLLNKPNALALMKQRVELTRSMSDNISQERAADFEDFKNIIDAERPDGCKLYPVEF
jgi:hypothetical protein